jgi:hypothetical protein
VFDYFLAEGGHGHIVQPEITRPNARKKEAVGQPKLWI